jgi:hypothetical protein
MLAGTSTARREEKMLGLNGKANLCILYDMFDCCQPAAYG